MQHFVKTANFLYPIHSDAQGVKFAPSMGYGLKLANPKEFFSESHRPSHFLEFSKLEVRRLPAFTSVILPVAFDTVATFE